MKLLEMLGVFFWKKLIITFEICFQLHFVLVALETPFLDMQTHVWQSSRAGRSMPVPLATQSQGPPAATSPPTSSLPSLPGSATTQPLPTPTTQTSARRTFPLFSTTSFSCRRHIRVILETKLLCSSRKPSWQLTSFVKCKLTITP